MPGRSVHKFFGLVLSKFNSQLYRDTVPEGMLHFCDEIGAAPECAGNDQLWLMTSF